MASVCDECQCTAGICRLSSRRTSRLLSGLRYSSRHHRGFDSEQAHHRYNDLYSPIARHLFRLPPRTDSVNQATFEGMCCNENTDLGESGQRVEKDKCAEPSFLLTASPR